MDWTENGIIWSYRFGRDGLAQPIPVENLTEALQADTGWLWLHLGLADVRCRSWIAEHAPLSDTARETLLDADEHVRLDLLGHEIVGILPDFHQEFLQDSDDLGAPARRHDRSAAGDGPAQAGAFDRGDAARDGFRPALSLACVLF